MKFFNSAFISLILSTSFFVSTANAGIILDENFDPITSADWTLSNGSILSGSEFYDENALHFNGRGIRSASTNEFDMTTGGLLSFFLKIGGSNDTVIFEDADAGEDVKIQYAVNGGSWVNLLTIDTENSAYKDTWGQVDINISASEAAASNNTKFQWIQAHHSGDNWDNWAIDNVLLSNNVPLSSNIAVPEPSTFAIFALGMFGLASRRLNKKA